MDAMNNSQPHEDQESWFKDQNALFDALTDSSNYDRRSRPLQENVPVHVNTSIYVSVLGGLDAHSTVPSIYISFYVDSSDF